MDAKQRFRYITFASLVLHALVKFHFAVAQVTPSQEIEKCLEPTPEARAVTYDVFVQGRPSRLLLHQVWHSPKYPKLDVPLTLFTSLTSSRLDQLIAQCKQWPGRLSAAIYVPIRVDETAEGSYKSRYSSTLDAAAATLQKMVEELNADASGCTLDAMLLYELISDDALMDVLPINTLRNYAMLQTRTDLVAMADVDLLPSKTLADYLAIPENIQKVQQMCAERAVVIIPTFNTAPQWKDEAVGHELATTVAAVEDKAQLRDMQSEGLVYQFHGTYFRYGHDCTNYRKWFETSTFYSVRNCWSKFYEPWFIINRKLNPPYNTVFRGFGWNKQSHVATIYHQGFDFYVIPEGFLVHRQHERSESRKRFVAPTQQDMQHGNIRAVTTRLHHKMMTDLRSGTYQPVVDDAFSECMHQLTWWQEAQQPTPPA